jgi:hypothetical protein
MVNCKVKHEILCRNILECIPVWWQEDLRNTDKTSADVSVWINKLGKRTIGCSWEDRIPALWRLRSSGMWCHVFWSEVTKVRRLASPSTVLCKLQITCSPAAYLGSPRLKSVHREWLAWQWFSAFLPGISVILLPIRWWQLPFTFPYSLITNNLDIIGYVNWDMECVIR